MNPTNQKPNCDEIRELLDLFHEDELIPSLKSLVQEHLNNCAGCNAIYNDTLRFSSKLEEVLKQISPSEVLKDRIMIRLRHTIRSRRLIYAVSAAAILVALSLMMIITSNGSLETAEPTFAGGQEIVFADGSYILLSPGSIYKINEPEKKVTFMKGALLLDNKGGCVTHIIMPANTIIKRGENFLLDTAPSDLECRDKWGASVFGLIELVTP